MGLVDSDAITEITITIPKLTAIKFMLGGDSFFESYPAIVNLVIKEMNRLSQEITEEGEKVVMIKRLLGEAQELGWKIAQIAQFSEALEEMAPEGYYEPKPTAMLTEVAKLNERLVDLVESLSD